MKNEHKPLFIPIGFYFTKRHIWRVKMFHKTIHNAWNLFKCLKQLPENLVLRVSIGREESSIDQMFFLINQTIIEQWSNHPMTLGLFSSSFWSIEQKLQQIENNEFRISLENLQNLNFHFIKQYSPNSNIIITT